MPTQQGTKPETDAQPPAEATVLPADAPPSPGISMPPPDAEDNPSPGAVAEPPDIDFSFLIGLDWPDEAPAYRSDVEVYPLTNMAMVYKTGVKGPVTFVGQDLCAIPLPFEPSGFGYIRGDDGVKGYTLSGAPGYQWEVLMLADGTVPYGADGQYISPANIGEDGAWYDTIGSAVITFRPGLQGYGWEDSLYGLYDMEERRELLPCEYEAICVVNGALFYATKGEQAWLFDEKGRELYALGSADGIRGVPLNYIYGSEKYYINAHDRIFYRLADVGFADEIGRWGDYIVALSAGEASGNLMVFDREGRELYRHEYYVGYYGGYQTFGEYLLFRTDGEFIMLDSGLKEKRFPIPPLDDDFFIINYIGEELVFDYGGNQSVPEQQYLALNEDGGLRDISFIDAGQPPILYRYPGQYIFVNQYHKTLVETDGYIQLCGNFIVLRESIKTNGMYSMRTDPKSVYAIDGSFQLDDIYGCIDEAPGPGGGIFIYLDGSTCVLLKPDGATIPVPTAPLVEKVYWGG